MAWTKLDDRFWSHPKIMGLSDKAFRLYVTSLNWSVSHLTDGHVPGGFMARLSMRSDNKVTRELVDSGLWALDSVDGYRIHDFAEYQPTKESDRLARKSTTRRQALWRDKALQAAIKTRDGGRCRYCNIVVSWSDRKSPSGATYDHIDPAGENTVENLVVACRGCNSSKADRTPEQWGTPLLLVTSYEPDTNQTATKPYQVPDPTRPDPDKEPTSNEVGVIDELWNILVEVHGQPAESGERGKFNKAHQKLRNAKVDAAEYPSLVWAYKAKWPGGAEPAVMTVATRVGEMRHFLANGPLKSVDSDEVARERWVAEMEANERKALA